MAVVLGESAGIITAAAFHDHDPAGTGGTIDGYTVAGKYTSPAGTNRIIEIGWYLSVDTSAAAYECGVYTNDPTGDSNNGKPNVKVGSFATGQSTILSTQGWYKYTGLNITIDASTIYWVAVGVSNVGAPQTDTSSSTGDRYGYKAVADGVLTDPWGTTDGGVAKSVAAIYAIYEAAAPAGGNRRRRILICGRQAA